MNIFPRFILKKADIIGGFRNRIKKAIAVAKGISDPKRRRSVAKQIKSSVATFKEFYNDEHLTVQELFDFARSVVDGVDSAVIAGRYGYGSPEMDKFIERQSEELERQLENRLWEEQMKERMRLERSSKTRSKR